MRIGIVGAENSHCAAVARVLNVDCACGQARVVAVWGETLPLAEQAARSGRIPLIVRRPEDMIGAIDGVMVDHRHARYHAAATLPFLRAGIPAFVDKPFTATVREGWGLFQRARAHGVPITSYSILPLQSGFRTILLPQIRAAGSVRVIHSMGPCDPKSKWGGIFFYGIHQIDLLLKAFGSGIEWVGVRRAGRGNPSAAAVMRYRAGGPLVSMTLSAEGSCPFAIRAVGLKGNVDYVHRFDPNPYLPGVRAFLTMFRTGKEPYTAAQILEPIAVLEALQKSFVTGRRVRVRRLPGSR